MLCVSSLHDGDDRVHNTLVRRIDEDEADRQPDIIPDAVDRRARADHDRGQAVGHVLSQLEGQMGALHQGEELGVWVGVRVYRDRDSFVVGSRKVRLTEVS